MMKKSKEDVSGAWYACAGLEQDIVVATRATLSRNLANFPFPDKLNDSESERIQSIVFDAFNFLKNAEDFQAISVCKLDGIGNKSNKSISVCCLFFTMVLLCFGDFCHNYFVLYYICGGCANWWGLRLL